MPRLRVWPVHRLTRSSRLTDPAARLLHSAQQEEIFKWQC